jgi:hypothetical protein
MINRTQLRTLLFTGLALLIFSGLLGRGEPSHAAQPRFSDVCLKDSESLTTSGVRYRALRFIDDPGTGRHWLLVQQLNHPEVPRTLVQIPDSQSCFNLALEGAEFGSGSRNENLLKPVIHPGDRLILSDIHVTSYARLEATALQPAAIGAALDVRLKFGGNILRAVATAAGHATLLVKQNETRR